MRRAANIDSNQQGIVTALRARGVIVIILARLGEGVPDLLCGYQGQTELLEVKLPQSDQVGSHATNRGRWRTRRADEYDPQFGFTPAETRFHARWRGRPIRTVRTIAEAEAVFFGGA